MIRISDAIQDEFIRGTTYDFADAPHQLWNKRPGQGRDQHTDQAAAPVGQARGGKAGNKLLLLHDTQYPLACRRVHVWLVVENTRDRGRRDTGQFSNITDSRLAWHN